MKNAIPSWSAVEANLRDLIVLKAEDLYFTAGGALGTQLVELLTGVPSVDCPPSDFFLDDSDRALIDPERLGLTDHLRQTHTLLSCGALGYRCGGGSLESDYLTQQHLEFIEMFLASISVVALGAWDGTSARTGAVYKLWQSGVAWAHLIELIDHSTRGDDQEPLTAADLAILGGIGELSVRNLIGPSREIRTVEADAIRKGRKAIGSRAFVSVRGIDALAWLRHRKSFQIEQPRPGFFDQRLRQIIQPERRGRAAIVAGLVLGETLDTMAAAAGHLSPDRLRAIGEGQADAAVDRLIAYVGKLDRERSLDTAPAPPEE